MKTMTTMACASLVLAAALSLAPSEGAAQVTCNQRDNVLGHLARKYQEVPVAAGEGWRALPKAAGAADPKA